MRVAAWAVAVELLLPFHHIAVAAVLRDQFVQLIAALARALAAFDAQDIELAFDVADDEVGSVARAYSITSSAATSSLSGTVSPSAFAVLRLIASSNLVARSTGRSVGLTPLSLHQGCTTRNGP
jgi:hypothetical protein